MQCSLLRGHCISIKQYMCLCVQEEDDVCAICVHSMVDVLAGAHRVHATHKIRRRAAMVIEPQLNLVILGKMPS